MRLYFTILVVLISYHSYSQKQLTVEIRMENKPVVDALVAIPELKQTFFTDKNGRIEILCTEEKITLQIEAHQAEKRNLVVECQYVKLGEPWIIHLQQKQQELNEVVVSGSLKEVDKLKTTVPIEIYNQKFLQKNPSPNLLEAIQQINGVRPQLNCNICNTGDIHMNGLEGAYTTVLIDGMPIVSSLASVYGLAGIPISMIERIEVIRGPSAVLYGSEAIGGLINVITKDPTKAPKLWADVFGTSWNELNLDLSFTSRVGKMKVLTGLNYFHYDDPRDDNNDGFTDLTIQKRLSLFNRFQLEKNKVGSTYFATRYVYEDRWGGEMTWTTSDRGGINTYGESIYTNRAEIIAKHKFNGKENIQLSGSYAFHDQNSFYGSTSFFAQQHTVFSQLVWLKDLSRHEMVAGVAYRFTDYDDNTFATADSSGIINQPQIIHLPGLFFQDEWKISEHQKLLFGARWDQSIIHGMILTPRIGYKFDLKRSHILRINAGSGYRIVNVFTEDHAALTGARKVIFTDELEPERSLNINLNYNGTFYLKNGNLLRLDISPFYSYFFNKILPDYQSDPNSIIYANTVGFAENKGIGITTEYRSSQLKLLCAATFMDVSSVSGGIRTRQVLSERATFNWTISYSFKKIPLEIDYTGNVYGPMELPLAGDLDPRPTHSPWWSIQNLQLNYSGFKQIEIYGGVKNLLNFLPGKNLPFLIARSHDPFDNLVVFDEQGAAQATEENPYALTFDPTYVFAPNQGIRFFLGIRFTRSNN
jgi:outer membrane receptor for ferrienterochelin and colicins